MLGAWGFFFLLEFQLCIPRCGHTRVSPTQTSVWVLVPVQGSASACKRLHARRALHLPPCQRAPRGSSSAEKAPLFICIGRRKKSSGSTGAGLLWLLLQRPDSLANEVSSEEVLCFRTQPSLLKAWRHRVSTNSSLLVWGWGVRRGPVGSVPAGRSGGIEIRQNQTLQDCKCRSHGSCPLFLLLILLPALPGMQKG